jgi:hypothetical protein
MENIKIKELFLSNSEKPFNAKDFYIFFKFTRLTNFRRFITGKTYKAETVYLNDLSKNKRELYFSRPLFLKLADIKLDKKDEFDEFYFEYKLNYLKTRLFNFKYTKKKEHRKELEGYINTYGYFYTYSLDTFLLSSFLEICPFDLFKHISNNYAVKFGFTHYTFVHGYYSLREKPIPMFYFNDNQHKERYRFIICLDNLIKEYKLNEFKTRLLKKYRELVFEMLSKQYEYDIIKENAEKKRQNKQTYTNYKTFYYNPSQKINLSENELKELKTIYRKAAFLCHPDKNDDGEALFKELNNANERNDYWKVKEIYEYLSRIKNQ